MRKSETMEILTGCGKVFLTQTDDNEFIAHGSKEFNSTSLCGESNLKAFCDLINLHSNGKKNLKELSEVFRGHACPKKLLGKTNARSCSDAIAKILERFVEDKKEEGKKVEEKKEEKKDGK